MARSEARLVVSLWDDPDFLALSGSEQRLFMFLISQPDLAHDGVIALRERRWSKKAAGLTVAQIEADLVGLSTARFVIVDGDTEELLIRSFIRRDKVYRQPNVLRAAADHLATVSSPTIKQAVAAELLRIQLADDIPEGSKAVLDGMLEALPSPPEDPSPNPSEKGSDKGSGLRPGERGVVTAVSSASPNPVPRAPDPVPRSLAPLAPPAPTSFDAGPVAIELFVVDGTEIEVAEPSNAGQLNRQWIDFCTGKGVKLTSTAIKRYGRHIKSALDQGFTVGHIKAALAGMLADRVVSRPALLDNYLIRVQQGPEMPPERLARHQADAERRAADAGTTAAARLYDTLTRPA